MNITYTKVGDYYYPDLYVEEGQPLSKYGRTKARYLKENQKALYTSLLMSGELNSYLSMIDDEAIKLHDQLVVDYQRQRNITEDLKGKDQMRWVQEMNNIENCIDEVIRNDIIYR